MHCWSEAMADGDKKSDFLNSVKIIHIGNFYASMTVITD